MKIAAVVSDFYPDIAEALLQSCRAELAAQKLALSSVASVPGALEIPFALDAVAKREKPDAMVALGCVIRGETFHFQIVSEISARGILEIQLRAGIPVGSAVLTVENMAQARARTGKGADAARAAVRLARL
ncbi:MAG: 6,7-dimethyl-8-ribityllumazine synthase [Gammaproteobacteria bacterium]